MRISDWSSDVCSSDLQQVVEQVGRLVHHALPATARSFDHRLHRFLADLLGDLVEAAMEQARGVRAVGIGAAAALDHRVERNIGRASCRERVCQYVYISVVAGSLKKKKIKLLNNTKK